MIRLQPRWKKVIRDVWRNKSRTVLIVMAIAVGVFAIGVVSGSQETLTRVLNEGYQTTNPASGLVIVDDDDFDDDFVETIAKMREVETAEGRREVGLTYKLNPAGEWQELRIKVSDDFEKSKIDKVWPETGQWPPPKKKLVLERASLEEMGAKIGDSLIIKTSEDNERVMVNGTRVTVREAISDYGVGRGKLGAGHRQSHPSR